ncbi:hypothetical protein E2C01_004156 [Portunus trituberculatus]|uniref:Uncharacterized protein n=1 Tax=Portunus trituberculatus TaxID=210409 RepID=A0A5B7CPV3_PORTR|nr:hypothetical protein [Portunus trituberculatus]
MTAGNPHNPADNTPTLPTAILQAPSSRLDEVCSTLTSKHSLASRRQSVAITDIEYQGLQEAFLLYLLWHISASLWGGEQVASCPFLR